MTRLFIDDVRSPPLGWALARTYDEAIALLSSAACLESVSFDHDLGTCDVCASVGCTSCACRCHMTGYDVVSWMEEHDIWPRSRPTVHSSNPVGRARIESVITRKYGG